MSCAVQYTHNDDIVGFDFVEDEVAAKHAPPDAGLLEPRQQGEGKRVFRKVLRLKTKFPNKLKRTARAVSPDVVGNAAKVLAGLLRKYDFHIPPGLGAAL